MSAPAVQYAIPDDGVRIASRAEGGQVLVANVVRELVAGKGFLFHDTGEHVLKGLEDPVRVWELRRESRD